MAAEVVSKIINTVINLAGIGGLIIGLAETQQLSFKDPEKKRIRFELFWCEYETLCPYLQ